MESVHKYSLENVTSNPSSPNKFKSILKSINLYKSNTDNSSLTEKCSSESDVFFWNKNVAKLFNKQSCSMRENHSSDDDGGIVVNRRYRGDDKESDSVDGGVSSRHKGGWIDEKVSSDSSSKATSAGKKFELQSRRNSRSEENLNFDRVSNMELEFLKLNAKILNRKKTDEIKYETEDILATALRRRFEGEKLHFICDTDDPDSTKILRSSQSLGKSRNHSHNEFDRDHIDSDNEDENKMMPPLQSPASPGVVTDSQGLIVPKKIINPCLESHDRQNLHRELMFNQKIGKSVLNQKSELQKALQKQKERQFISEQKYQQKSKPENVNGELERVIMQRAQRLENSQKPMDQNDPAEHINPEYLNARAKLRHTIELK